MRRAALTVSITCDLIKPDGDDGERFVSNVFTGVLNLGVGFTE